MRGINLSLATVVHRGEAAIHRLAKIGLAPEPLFRAVRAAELGREACTAHHVPTFPGFRAWAEGNKCLADELAQLGFTLRIEANVPVLLHPTDSLAITMVAGDSRTGTSMTPSTRNARGPASARMIDVGLDLFSGTQFGPAVRPDSYELWMLLWFRWGDAIRCELSQPRLVVEGEVESWIERIITEPFTVQDGQSEVTFHDGADVDVPISRKAE